MFRRIFILLCLALMAALPATAETWQSRTSDSGSLVFGAAFLPSPERGLSFGCTAPSRQGRSLIETGSHESHRNGPFEMTVSLGDRLFDWAPPYRLTNVVIWIGNTGYRLPPVELDELLGTAVYLSMTDQMIAALFDAPSLVLDTGQGKRYSYPVEGLAPALETALAYCANQWAGMGQPAPGGLNPRIAAAMRTAPAPAPSPAPALSTTPRIAPGFITDMIKSSCGVGGYVLDLDTALGQADFDGDNVPDYIFSGYGLRCYQKLNPFCGASKCSVEVYLSSRGYANVEGWIGSGFAIGHTAYGRAGFYRFGNRSRPLEIWNGASFVPTQ